MVQRCSVAFSFVSVLAACLLVVVGVCLFLYLFFVSTLISFHYLKSHGTNALKFYCSVPEKENITFSQLYAHYLISAKNFLS